MLSYEQVMELVDKTSELIEELFEEWVRCSTEVFSSMPWENG